MPLALDSIDKHDKSLEFIHAFVVGLFYWPKRFHVLYCIKKVIDILYYQFMLVSKIYYSYLHMISGGVCPRSFVCIQTCHLISQQGCNAERV